MEYKTLSNGVKMPMVGYGVFLIENDECEKRVLQAIEAGYRHIDTAQAYWNEEGVGNAIVKSNVLARNCLLPPKCGWQTRVMKKRKPQLRNPCANYKRTISICC
ncbi:aldo/keto reductase [Pasteurellaceae bacterium LIM206]|nr:aldo/keto reductase [Pasteurellaceae bacterium LIM206]